MKLAIVTSHPIQYYAPWFRHLAKMVDLRVFYLWDFGIRKQRDQGFGQSIQWDIPLLDGYDHLFVPNSSTDPGTHHFWGLNNPQLRAELEAWGPDAVLFMVYRYAGLLPLIGSWKRCPMIFRGDSHRLLPGRGMKELVRRITISAIFRRFSAVLNVGKANKEYYRYHGIPDNRIFFSPHCIDNERFATGGQELAVAARKWREGLCIDKDKPLILFAGKFQNKKRPLDLIHAFKGLEDKATLLCVGAGELEESMRAAAAGNASILFAPFQNQSQMPMILAAADLLVLPSYGPSETWGLIVNEAFALGKPAIVSSHVGCGQDLVEDGVTGLVYPAGDVAALRKALCRTIDDPVQLKSWGANAQSRIQKYSYTAASNGLMDALRYVGGDV